MSISNLLIQDQNKKYLDLVVDTINVNEVDSKSYLLDGSPLKKPNPSYANFYKPTTTTDNLVIPAVNTYVIVNNFVGTTNSIIKNFTFNDGLNQLTYINETAKIFVALYNLTIFSSTSPDYEIGIFKNGVLDICSRQKIEPPTSDETPVSGGCLIYLEQGDTVDLRMQNTNNADDVGIVYCNMTLISLAEN